MNCGLVVKRTGARVICVEICIVVVEVEIVVGWRLKQQKMMYTVQCDCGLGNWRWSLLGPPTLTVTLRGGVGAVSIPPVPPHHICRPAPIHTHPPTPSAHPGHNAYARAHS